MSGLSARLVVRDPSFELDAVIEVAPGEVLALVGPNGAGKSTAIRLLAGIAALDAGRGGDRSRIEIDGRIVDEPATSTFVPPASRRIGVVFQDHLLFDHLDAVDNVAFGLRASGVSRSEARRRARELLDEFGLGDQGNRRPSELSGGQAQRVAIARALAIEPDALLLDEPLAALDVETRASTRRLLADRLASLSIPVVIVSHDPADAFLLADRIAVIEAGRITQVGRPEDIRTHPATRYVAALSGTNLLRGSVLDGTISFDGGGQLFVPDRTVTGPVLCTIRPSAVVLHESAPSGSARNTWSTSIAQVDAVGERVRVTLDVPLSLAVDVTPSAVEALSLVPGKAVWASLKATDIVVQPDV